MTHQPTFEGKVAFVTGAGAGIGRATAVQLAARGAAVAFLTRSQENCRTAQDEIAALGGRVLGMVGDVADPGDVETSIGRAVDEFGGLDVVVANAGIGGEPATIVDTTVEDWDRVIAVNLTGVFLTAKYAIATMLERASGGAVVIVGSDASIIGCQSLLAYTTAKHALVGLTRSLALDHGPQNVRTNLVCPTSVATDMMREFAAEHPAVAATWVASVPQGRIATPQEVANVICHLASDEASFTNGLIYALDGGVTAGIYSKADVDTAVESGV